MATMNVSLPEQMKEWVEAQVGTGRFGNSSDYVRNLIRQDQDYQDKREALVQALIEGEESGESKRSVQDIFTAVKKKHGIDV
ncbi:MAG: type II toxin-antitoxin system ParD family antitoxin [Alteromonadaceae bacterium]|nr:MAG: type II toxin-antitoxin system ParD family antitoxin [Alteromonadaceae bacterium]